MEHRNKLHCMTPSYLEIKTDSLWQVITMPVMAVILYVSIMFVLCNLLQCHFNRQYLDTISSANFNNLRILVYCVRCGRIHWILLCKVQKKCKWRAKWINCRFIYFIEDLLIINCHEKTPVPNVTESWNNLSNILQLKTVCEVISYNTCLNDVNIVALG